MRSEEKQVKKSVEKLSETLNEEKGEELSNLMEQAMKKGIVPKDLLGFSDQMVEGIYGQAYRLYNSGNYKDAILVFQLLVMINSMEAKYCLGLAACYHMQKDYKTASDLYMMCSVLDTQSPIPSYHASDCYLKMHDSLSALVALEVAIEKAGARPEYKTLKDRASLTLDKIQKDLNTKAEELKTPK